MDTFAKELSLHASSLRAFAVSLTRRHAPADDLVQETMLKAWNKQESFELGTNMKAWLFTIMKNEFYSQMRKRGREVQDPDDVFTNGMAVSAGQYSHMDLLDLNTALKRLPKDQREAIVMVGAAGDSYEEAAEAAGCAVGTMKSRVSRARTTLKRILGENEKITGPQKHIWTERLKTLQRIPKEPKQPKTAFVFRRKFRSPTPPQVTHKVPLAIPPPAAVPQPIVIPSFFARVQPKQEQELLTFCGMEFEPLSRLMLSSGGEAQIYSIVE